MKVYLGPYPKDGRERKMRVRIDKYDSWNADYTLALVILPVLKQLRNTTHGAPGDMLEFQQTSNQAQYSFDFYAEEDNKAWDTGHQRWLSLLDEMIWSFEQLLDEDWEYQYWKTQPELQLKDGKVQLVKGEVDREGMQKHHERIQKGLDLFGKYFRNLWD